MDLIKWAEKEIELACEKERRVAEQHGDPDGAGYGIGYYQSALKAFKSLCEDEHSGFSIGMTMHILNRLVNIEPLTPVFDTEDVWEYCWNRDEIVTFQCTRMSSLFKRIHPDGTIKYEDNDRIRCYDPNDERHITWSNGFISHIINKMYPITMPYCPGTKYEVAVREFLTDGENGDFDTMEIAHVYIINGRDEERVEINRFFKEENNKWVEIGLTEFLEREHAHYDREYAAMRVTEDMETHDEIFGVDGDKIVVKKLEEICEACTAKK